MKLEFLVSLPLRGIEKLGTSRVKIKTIGAPNSLSTSN